MFFRFESYGSENVPDEKEGRGVILAPNHASFLDPPLVGISTRRRVTFLAKDYLFKAFFVGFVLRKIEAFPIKTDTGDLKSIRELVRLLKKSKCVVVFPEGTRSPDDSLREPESGIGFLAMKSEAYIVPVYIQGTFKAFPRGVKFFKCHKVRAYFGKPFIPALDEEIVKQTDPYKTTSLKIMAEIKALKEKAKQV